MRSPQTSPDVPCVDPQPSSLADDSPGAVLGPDTIVVTACPECGAPAQAIAEMHADRSPGYRYVSPFKPEPTVDELEKVFQLVNAKVGVLQPIVYPNKDALAALDEILKAVYLLALRFAWYRAEQDDPLPAARPPLPEPPPNITFREGEIVRREVKP